MGEKGAAMKSANRSEVSLDARAKSIKRRRILGWLGAGITALLLGLTVYGGIGYFDALRDAPMLKKRAHALIKDGRGPVNLTANRLRQLLRVEDPAFFTHKGVDFKSNGTGLTTITQSLSKRLAFNEFKPGIRKVRQTTYAFGLENRLSKNEILALSLDKAQLGPGPSGWMEGMFDASIEVYGKPPAEISDRQWLNLVAVLIAPKKFNLLKPDADLDERVRRIERLLSDKCQPEGARDVWLEGCA